MKKLVVILVAVILAGLLAPGAHANHWEKYIGPDEPSRDFPKDFLPLLPKDKQSRAMANPWKDRHIGGWGSNECPADHEPLTPVIFVHGNGGHAGHWTTEGAQPAEVNVKQAFLDAGYCPRELWAMSYDGAGSYSTYDDINAPEVYKFIEAVRGYLHVDKIDVVTHSLGVTVLRKAAFQHREMYDYIRRFVAIAGATHGTTTCRGTDEKGILHVCDEISPGSKWLEELNGIGQTPSGPDFLSIYDGTGVADDFYLGPDALSPQMEGACNHPLPGLDHFSLAWSPQAVDIYLTFVMKGKLPECVPYAYEASA
jgi:pimeloyl-ACP methyl ester carboxylesterase